MYVCCSFLLAPWNIEQTPRKTIIAALVVIGAIASASAQLSYHLDANTNSYTLQTPNSQQTFTRYFGQANGNGIAASQSQQQVDIINVFSDSVPAYFCFNISRGEFTFRKLFYLCMVIWILNCFGAIYRFLQHGKCGKLLCIEIGAKQILNDSNTRQVPPSCVAV